MSTSLRADVFPARLRITSADSETTRTLDRLRILVTADAVLVFQDSPQGPRLVFSERLASYTRPTPSTRTRTPGSRHAIATTESGKTLEFSRMGSCGCGSRLKNFNPFTSLGSDLDAPSYEEDSLT